MRPTWLGNLSWPGLSDLAETINPQDHQDDRRDFAQENIENTSKGHPEQAIAPPASASLAIAQSSELNCPTMARKENATILQSSNALPLPHPVPFATLPRSPQTVDNLPAQLHATPPRPTQTEYFLHLESHETSNQNSANMTLSPAKSTVFPDFHGTDRERLYTCLNALKLNHSITLSSWCDSTLMTPRACG